MEKDRRTNKKKAVEIKYENVKNIHFPDLQCLVQAPDETVPLAPSSLLCCCFLLQRRGLGTFFGSGVVVGIEPRVQGFLDFGRWMSYPLDQGPEFVTLEVLKVTYIVNRRGLGECGGWAVLRSRGCVVVGVWGLLHRPLFLAPLSLSKPCEASLVDKLLGMPMTYSKVLLDTFDEVLVGNPRY